MNFHSKSPPRKQKKVKSKLRQFSTADLSRKIGDVTFAANQGPVTITHHGKPRYVLMSHDEYRRRDTRKVYRSDETPPELAKRLLPALDRIASGDFDYDET